MPSEQLPDIFAKAETVMLSAEPRAIEFAYPAAGNMSTLVRKILGGGEYPILDLPNYEPRLIVDIGANVGAAALFFALRYPAAEVHCYEPSRLNVAFLERNIRSLPRIHAHPFGLHDRDQEIDLFLGAGQSMQCSVIRSVETGTVTERIQLQRARPELARIGLGGGGCLLKIDTEGCELPILRDLGGLLGGADLIYLEYHSESDRRNLDALLAEGFTLAYMRADYPHRGSALYAARRLFSTYPALDMLRLDRPPA